LLEASLSVDHPWEDLLTAVVRQTKETGVLPCIKLMERSDCLPFAQAMFDGGARVVEVTMTTPGALDAIEAIAAEFKGRLFVAAGTVLDAPTAREVILRGGSLIVSPSLRKPVIRLARRYGVPVYAGAFTATECLEAVEAGATMIKVFPAHIGGPKYMTNLKMVYPEIDLVPSGGVSLANAGEFIRCGAAAVSGARTFLDPDRIAAEGLGWISRQVAAFIAAVRTARQDLPPLP
jgi:2-dehydro-3-deoxyphosphogluconate aldolase/(4S)-4-hydroxy-2-oxoglutarate aldolase